jgi:hypothetical protein
MNSSGTVAAVGTVTAGRLARYGVKVSVSPPEADETMHAGIAGSALGGRSQYRGTVSGVFSSSVSLTSGWSALGWQRTGLPWSGRRDKSAGMFEFEVNCGRLRAMEKRALLMTD